MPVLLEATIEQCVGAHETQFGGWRQIAKAQPSGHQAAESGFGGCDQEIDRWFVLRPDRIANDGLSGGLGADHLIGGAGTDTVDYSSAVTLNFKTGVQTGEAAGDTFDSIETFADTLTSSTASHQLTGGARDDTYVVGQQSVVVTEADGGGDDEIRTSLNSYSVSAAAGDRSETAGGRTSTGRLNGYRWQSSGHPRCLLKRHEEVSGNSPDVPQYSRPSSIIAVPLTRF